MHAGDAGDARDAVEQQFLEGIHVGDDDLDLVVGFLSGDQQAFENFRYAGDLAVEILETLRRVGVHRDVDERHQ